MNKVAKFITVSGAIMLAGMSVAGSASAEERFHRGSNDAVAAGIFGLAAGVVAGAILSNSNPSPAPSRVYVAHDDDWQDDDGWNRQRHDGDWRRGQDWRDGDRYAYRQLQPWSRDWYRWCENRYDSFDPRSGTFVDGYGQERFCVAR